MTTTKPCLDRAHARAGGNQAVRKTGVSWPPSRDSGRYGTSTALAGFLVSGNGLVLISHGSDHMLPTTLALRCF